ncbi:MAG: glycerol-3-phosphate dehydrogenase/oxidase [Actinobacteria bacterium]|nr:glycerol-3-phosphate dehydrogenase/oxidase [Actinomycetota bacterium]
MPSGVAATAPLPSREDALAAAAGRELDVLVVGGGITGAGIALDAVTRGYRVALVERDDLASGTSSRSSKLVHGGVRYLATGDVAMVAEGVRERDRLRRLAPHLVRPLGFVLPVDDRATQLQLKAGMAAYDGLALGRNVRRHRRLSVAEVLAAAPGLATGMSLGGYRYYDCQTDDARLTLQIAQVARSFGALVVNHAEVTGFRRAAGGRVAGAEVRDRLTGRTSELTARWTISAAGVWADDVRGLATEAPAGLLPAKGVHLTFPRHLVRVNQAVVVPSGSRDGRRNFVIPWGEQVYVGTTDERWDGDPDRPDLEQDEADYLLTSVNAAFATDLTVADAVGAWAGVRPLLSAVAAASPGASKDLSRRHAITEDPPGLVTITGGKLTTYRQMAEEAVDVVAAADARSCVTTRIPLGARGTAEDGLARTREAARALDLDPTVAGSVYHRHGDRAPEVLTACAEGDGAEPLVAGLPYLRGEVRWAVRHELARTVADVLQRRTRVSLRDAAAGGAAIAWTADVLAEELGWDGASRTASIDAYLEAVRHERGPVALDTSWRDRDDAAIGTVRS